MSLFSRTLRITAVHIKKTWPATLLAPKLSHCSTKAMTSVPKVQGTAPQFEGVAVIDQDFKEIKLSDYKGKYVVFYFYPLDFTFVCPTEIIAFSEIYEEFKKIDTEVIGCSTDSQYSHLAWKNLPRKSGGIGDIKYPLLSDYNKITARNYNVLLEPAGVALRGLFIIDTKGVIRHMSVNDLPVGRSVEEVLRLVKAFQFNDKHGEGIQLLGDLKEILTNPEPNLSPLPKKKLKETILDHLLRSDDVRKSPKVCPANWKPDSATIKPTPKDSKEYFSKVNK